jgi:hypothetical protein
MNIKPILLTGIALIAFTFMACNDDSSDDAPGDTNTSTGLLTDTDKDRLFDKYWYTGQGINFIFKKDGTFQLNKSLDGTWKWRNNGDTMEVVNSNNSKYLNLFMEIGASTAKYRSNQGGDNFKTVVTLSDKE